MISQTIGWTLIHSLWQGLAIYVVLRVVVRLTGNANVRYGLGVGALGLLVLCSMATFGLLTETPAAPGYQLTFKGTSEASASTTTVLQWIDNNIIWLIRFWMAGFSIGLLRIASGLWYINRLRRNSNPVQDEWMEMVRRLSESLNVNRVVAMAEAGISSPMVVGFMKPVILFPVGLLSGLSTEQVETILVHELSHIRRQDYIINLVQSVIETIFFFNPFALLISSMIREERENCCDDMVIAKGISPISYVRTLAQLEASRSSSKLALGFAGNQNQLLNRIKRIMENSAKNDWGKGRLVPVALLFIGLVCASWLSIHSEKEIEANHLVVTQDTTRGWIVVDPPEPVDMFHFETPEPPDFEMPPMPDFAPMPDFDFEEFTGWDSIPGYYFKMRDVDDWDKFEQEFTEKFKTQFNDFYKKNEEEIKQLMEDLKKDQAGRREAAEMVDLAQIERLAEMEHIVSRDMIDAMKRMEMMTDQISVQEILREQQMDILDDQLRKQTILMEDMARQGEAYTKELNELMIEDGYIKKGEGLGDLHIQDFDGGMTINGKKIKEKDALKYRALRDSYFQNHKMRTRERHPRNE